MSEHRVSAALLLEYADAGKARDTARLVRRNSRAHVEHGRTFYQTHVARRLPGHVLSLASGGNYSSHFRAC